MALDASDLRVLYSSAETDILRPLLHFPGAMNRRWERDIQNAATVKIPTRNHTVSAVAHTRGSDWGTDEDAANIDLQDLTLNMSSKIRAKFSREDAAESPLDVLATLANEHAFAHAKRFNTLARGIVVAGAKAANKIDKGTSSNYIPSSGAVAGTGDDLLADGMHEAVIKLTTENVLAPGANERSVTCFMPGYLAAVLRKKAVEDGWSDGIVDSALTSGNFAGGGRQPGHWFNFLGIPVIATNEYSTEEVSSKDYAVIIFMTRNSTTYGARPAVTQLFTPATNPDGPNFALRSLREAACRVTDDDQIVLLRVRQEA